MGRKYRSKGVKREHNIIQDVPPLLEKIAAHPKVKSVIPGRIKVTQSNAAAVKLRIQTKTVSGIKLSARSRSASQEVFVVTDVPDEVADFLVETLGLEVPTWVPKAPPT
ncbi:MAG: DUF2103 domain-containing protein [Chloroflexi bacterium]|nr:DUF2103 domain-containing protein [Chloroflexota bacterium]